MIVFVVTMQRWGNDETHNYVLGVYSTRALAEAAGETHQMYRGNKYEPNITECVIKQHLKELSNDGS